MKNIKLLVAFIFALLLGNKTFSQTCTNPIDLDPNNGQFSQIDSFSVQNRFFKFTANSNGHVVKTYIKGLVDLGFNNQYVKIYLNDCTNLAANELTTSVTISGDTIISNSESFSQGNSYLIELGKIVNNSLYVVYSIQVNNIVKTSAFGCFFTNPCTLPSCELICNGSFEATSGPLTVFNGDLYLAYNWLGSNPVGTSDLFSSTSSFTESSTPCNARGQQTVITHTNCTTSNNYAGIASSNVGSAAFTEYLQTQLSQSMTPGKTYVISFWVSKADNFFGTLNSLGIWLTPNPTSTTGAQPLALTPNYSINNPTLLNDKNIWRNIKICHLAVGTESYLTIGRPATGFVSPGSTLSPVCGALLELNCDLTHFLYVDDVSIRPLEINVTSSTPTVNVCGSANLNASHPCGVNNLTLTYSWIGNTLNNPAIPNPVATVTTSTNYNVNAQGFDSNGQPCAVSGNVTITSLTLTPLTITPSNPTVCPNTSVSLSVSGGVGNYTLLPGSLIGNNFVVFPPSNTTYTAIGTTTNGCTITKTITIFTYTSTISASASPNNICVGFSSTLTGLNGSNFTWQPGSLSGTTVVVSPASTTIYTVSGLSVNGCSKTSTVQVTVNNPPLLSVSPAASNTICLNSPINLIPSGAVTYTWLPMNTPTTNIVVSPTTSTTYTVNGTSIFGCIGTTTVFVSVNPLPNVTCSASPVVCPNTSATLSASGAITFTWFPINIPFQTTSVSPSVTTNYTVIGTSALGCTNNCVVTQSVYPLTANFFSIVSNPSVICVQSPSATTATLSVIGSPNYTWIPSNVVNSSITSSVAGTFSAIAIYTNGCTYTATYNLAGTDIYAAINPTVICSNSPTLNLYNLTLFSSGATFSVNGTAASNVFGPNPSPGVYTIEILYTNSVVCSPYAINTITVLAAPATPTVTMSNSVACIGDQFTITATPSSQTYTWFPFNFVGNPLVITPTAATSVTLASGPSECSVSIPAFTIPFFNATCVCVQNCGAILTGTITNGIYSSQIFCIPGTLFINGVVTFSNADLRIAPNVSIVVTSGSALNILGSHLYACDKMWSGIVVKQGGQVNMFPSSANTPFIEDALIAVDVEQYFFNQNATNILTVANATFNRNVIGIRIGSYRKNQNNYPFTIQNSLFTSRNIPFTPLNWPQTNTIKLSPSGGNSMQTPYIDNTTYSVTGLKANNVSTVIITYGMVIKDVGYTSIPLGATFKDISVGQNGGGPSGFNCFDNLHVDVYSLNSNVTVVNSVFQNGNYANRSIVPTGLGIYAVASPADDVNINNYRLQVFPGTPSGNFTNKFYDKKTCVDVVGYLSTEIKFAECYSSLNDYGNPLYVSNGFLVNTNRYLKIYASENKLYNIGNSMMVSLDVGFYAVGNQAGNGRLVGGIVINKNLIKNHITTPSTGEYVNIGISVQDPFASSPVAYAPSGVNTSINQNTITSVHNGIDVKNISFATVDINKNIIDLVNEPNTFVPVPIQYGINTEQLQFKALITQNKVIGATTYSPGVHAINTALNALMSVRCNTTSFTNRGIQFNNGQTVDYFEDNLMSNQNLGFVLDNNAVTTNQNSVNVMGDINRPTNNIWDLVVNAPNYKTATLAGSSAQNARMYVNITTPYLNPNGSGSTTGPLGVFDYYYNGNSGTLLQANPVTPSCRISNNSNNSNNSAQNVLASMVSGSIIYTINPIETQMINKHMAYRTLKVNQSLLNNSSVLTNFYNNAQNNCLQQLCAIENDLMNTDYTNAQIKINSFSPSCQIETNYKNYYQILKNTKDSTYSISDSLNLISLANQCPYIDGGVVFQARALYNILYRGYYKFAGNCSSSYSNRQNTEIEEEGISVILKSKLYPNPNNGAFKIELQNPLKTLNFTVVIYDIMGKTVFKSEYSATSVGMLEIDSKLLKGIYLVKIVFEDNSADIHRLIID